MSDLLKARSDTLRALLLSTHYRRPIDFGPNRLEEIEQRIADASTGPSTFRGAHRKHFYTLEARRRDDPPAP